MQSGRLRDVPRDQPAVQDLLQERRVHSGLHPEVQAAAPGVREDCYAAGPAHKKVRWSRQAKNFIQ